MDIREHIPLAPLTTFHIGGGARYVVEVKSEEEVGAAVAYARDRRLPFTVLGGGSNVLVSDSGFDGLVIHIVSGSFSFEGDVLTAQAGCNVLALIHAAAKNNLGGWEKLAGIPGSIGGAVRGNAGAFGSEMKDFLVSARAIDSVAGEAREFAASECDFSYRHSFFKDNPQWIITSAQVRLVQTAREESERLAAETIAEREKRHLQHVRAAGSYFMNPIAPPEVVALFEQEKEVRAREGRVPAGWLIEKVGMKGARVGGAKASEQHPNYLVNESGSATAHDVRTLAQHIKDAVHMRFGVVLKEEAAML